MITIGTSEINGIKDIVLEVFTDLSPLVVLIIGTLLAVVVMEMLINAIRNR